MVYKNRKKNLQATLYCKPTEQKSYLHAKLEHSNLLKNSIPFSQMLRLQTICSTEDEHQRNCVVMKQKYLEIKIMKTI